MQETQTPRRRVRRAGPDHFQWSRTCPAVLTDEIQDPRSHRIADPADALGTLPLRVLEAPVLPAQTGHEGARFTAPHRDQERRRTGDALGQAPRPRTAHVDPEL